MPTQYDNKDICATPSDFGDYKITKEVQEVGEINISGNVIPAHWYKILTYASGKANFIAIILLSDILYWYRPTEVRSEGNGQVIGYKKKFKSDFLQRQTKAYASQFGFSEKQVREALKFLEDQGYIKRHFRDIDLGKDMGVISNRQYIELIPDAIKRIQKIHTYNPTGGDPHTSRSTGVSPQGEHTYTTSDTTTNTVLSVGEPPPLTSEDDKIKEPCVVCPVPPAAPSGEKTEKELVTKVDAETRKAEIIGPKGQRLVIDQTTLYQQIIAKRVSWTSDEILYAWEGLCSYEGQINDWWRFMEGTIHNLRTREKNKRTSTRSRCPKYKHSNRNLKCKKKISQESKNSNNDFSEHRTGEQAYQKSPSIQEILNELQNG